MSHAHRYLILASSVVLLSACTTWRASSEGLEPPIPARERREIWVEGRRIIVHGIQFRNDTVRAVPYWKAPDCDSCAIYWPRAAIDSVRVPEVAPGNTVVLGGAVLIVLFVWTFLSRLNSPSS